MRCPSELAWSPERRRPAPPLAPRESSSRAGPTPVGTPPPGAACRCRRRPRPGTLGADPLATPARPRTPLLDAASCRGRGPLAVDSTLLGPVSLGLTASWRGVLRTRTGLEVDRFNRRVGDQENLTGGHEIKRFSCLGFVAEIAEIAEGGQSGTSPADTWCGWAPRYARAWIERIRDHKPRVVLVAGLVITDPLDPCRRPFGRRAHPLVSGQPSAYSASFALKMAADSGALSARRCGISWSPSEAPPQTVKNLAGRLRFARTSVGSAPLRGADISNGPTRELASFVTMVAIGDV